MKRSKAFVFYRGPSMLDGSPIVAIATRVDADSQNDKTGAMVQTMIIRSDMHPLEALENGGDAAICGECIHRPLLAKRARDAGRDYSPCYVNVGQSVASVWRCLTEGSGYDDVSVSEAAELLSGKLVRLGTYGDPMAVPFEVWRGILAHARGHTGYTHQWARPGADQRFRVLCMASADRPDEAVIAKRHGWRVFRVTRDLETMTGEVRCPASAEAGNRTNCAACRACGGTASKARASIVIVDHGPGNRKRKAA